MRLNVFNNIVDTATYIYNTLSNDFSESLLSSSDGTLGLEWYITENKVRKYLFSQKESIELESQPKLMVSMESNDLSCYTLGSYKSSCFPFRMKLKENVLDTILRYVDKSVTNEQILIQVLLKKIRASDWQPETRQQYFDYVNGIDIPIKNNLGRTIQYRILEFLQDKEEFLGRNPTIEGAEQKFTEGGFESYIRFAIYGGTKEKRNQIATKVKLGFSTMNYSNSWIMNQNLLKGGFMNNLNLRKFPMKQSDLILSVSELLPLFSSYNTESANTEMNVSIVAIDSDMPKNTSGAMSDVIELFPKGEKLAREFDSSKFEAKLNKAFKKLHMLEDGRLIKIKSVHEGATLRKITFKLPEGLTLSTLSSKKSIQNIETEMALQNIAMEQGIEAGTANLVVPQDEREMVLLRDCLDNKDFQRFNRDAVLPFVLGMDSMGNPVYECLDRIRHLLAVGMSGSGKSVLINSILTTLFMLRSPKQLQALLLDPKQVELAIYSNYKHVIDVLTDKEESYVALLEMVDKMEERYEILAKRGCRNLEQYNSKVSESEKLPHIVVVIEELADYMLTFKDFDRPIEILAGKARAAGIHLLIITQKPLSNIVTSLVKGNIISRICLLCDGWRSYNVALDESIPFELLGKGDGVYRFEGKLGLHRFQSARIGRNDNEDESIIEQLSEYWKGNFKKEVINLDVKKLENEDLLKMKKIILESGNTKVTELSKLIKVRSEKISEMMMALVEDGWLLKHKSKAKGYELLLNDEQRKSELAKLK